MRAPTQVGVPSGPLQHNSAIGAGRRGFMAAFACGVCTPALVLGTIGPARAQEGKKDLFPSMAAVAQYRMADRSEEIAMARSAAPVSISSDADVLVLGDGGFETAVNGFVCLVERSWFASFDDAEFWNPKIRSPICLNARAASTVLSVDLEKTQWALAGLSKAEMIARTRSFGACAPSACTGLNGRHDVQAGVSVRCRRALAPTSDVLSAAYGLVRLGRRSS